MSADPPSSPLASPKKAQISNLQQFKVESPSHIAAESADIEICVESIIIPDSDEAICDLLVNKYMKNLFFYKWKMRSLSVFQPSMTNPEIQAISAQCDRSPSSQFHHQRRHFMNQCARLAIFSIKRNLLSYFFWKWSSRFISSRTRTLQASVSRSIGEKRLLEGSFHQMRSSAFQNVSATLSEASRSLSMSGSPERIRELNEELQSMNRRSEELENAISTKSEQLNELQISLRSITLEDSETSKRLKELNEVSQNIQQSLKESEKSFQEEIASLKAQIDLSGKDDESELTKAASDLQQNEADRRAISTFIDDAKSASAAEVASGQEKVSAAQKIVRSLETMLSNEKTKTEQLGSEKQMLEAELESLRIRRKQTTSEKESLAFESSGREEKLKRMLMDSQHQLEAALVKIDAQGEQIRSKQKEVQMLREDIARQKATAEEAQNRFLSERRRKSPQNK